MLRPLPLKLLQQLPLPRLAPAPPGARGPLPLTEPYGAAIVIGPVGSAPDERRLRGLGQAVAETLAGRRPPESIQDKMSERAYAGLLRAGTMLPAQRPVVGLPHVQQPRDDVVEMCLLVRCDDDRSRVLALRLERRGVQWVITEFETA
jgi:hypothetical protein